MIDYSEQSYFNPNNPKNNKTINYKYSTAKLNNTKRKQKRLVKNRKIFRAIWTSFRAIL